MQYLFWGTLIVNVLKRKCNRKSKVTYVFHLLYIHKTKSEWQISCCKYLVVLYFVLYNSPTSKVEIDRGREQVVLHVRSKVFSQEILFSIFGPQVYSKGSLVIALFHPSVCLTVRLSLNIAH